METKDKNQRGTTRDFSSIRKDLEEIRRGIKDLKNKKDANITNSVSSTSATKSTKSANSNKNTNATKNTKPANARSGGTAGKTSKSATTTKARTNAPTKATIRQAVSNPLKQVSASRLNQAKQDGTKEEKMYVIPLGGLEEIGKNTTLFQYRDEMILLDAGNSFPDENLLGIDLVMPDLSYIENNKSKIKAVCVTHGHEDHIGAIPYLYEKIDNTVPIYSGRLTLELIKAKFQDSRSKSKVLPKMKEVTGRTKVKIGKYFTVEFVRVTHSIADAYGVCITTPAGTIFHTGDFKVDMTPIDNEVMDFARIAEIGERGVDLLMSDSTNSEVEGFTPSEKTVGESFRRGFATADGRIIVAAFASHIHRLQQIITATEAYGRKLAIDGRSLVKVFEIASKLGYLKFNKDMIIPLTGVDEYDDSQVVILCTGTQGEPMSALSRIAKGMHKNIKVKKGDTVIISATPIPGNEKAVTNIINNLFKDQAEVIFKKVAGIHVSGHGSKEEEKLMLALTKPRYFMPVHGEMKHLTAHKRTAMEMGVPEENVIIAQNGSKVQVTHYKSEISGKVNAGFVLVDGSGVGDVGNVVLKDRQQLSQDGVVTIACVIDKVGGRLLSDPEVVTRGFIFAKEAEELISEAKKIVKSNLIESESLRDKDWVGVKNIIIDSASKYFFKMTKRTPVVLPLLLGKGE